MSANAKLSVQNVPLVKSKINTGKKAHVRNAIYDRVFQIKARVKFWIGTVY